MRINVNPILIAHRFGRQFKVYDRILPSQLLDVTDIIEASPRQCVICGVLAEWECSACFGDHDSGLQSTAFCHTCLTRTHQHARRTDHKTERLKTPVGWNKQKTGKPIPRCVFWPTISWKSLETFCSQHSLQDLHGAGGSCLHWDEPLCVFCKMWRLPPRTLVLLRQYGWQKRWSRAI